MKRRDEKRVSLSVSSNAPQDFVQFCEHLFLLLDSFQSLCLGDFKLLLQILDGLTLLPLAVVESREKRNQKLYLLLLHYQIARKFELACLEDFGRIRLDWHRGSS